MSDLLSAEQLAQIEALHVISNESLIHAPPRPVCAECDDYVPCDSAQLVAHCRALEARVAELEGALSKYSNHEDWGYFGNARVILRGCYPDHGWVIAEQALAAPTRAGDGGAG